MQSVVGLPGDGSDDHDDDEGAEGMVVELESKPEFELSVDGGWGWHVDK